MVTRRGSCLVADALVLFSLRETGFAQCPPSVTVVPAIRTAVGPPYETFGMAFDADGQRILLGYVEAPLGTPALTFYGVSANAVSDGREVRLALTGARTLSQ